MTRRELLFAVVSTALPVSRTALPRVGNGQYLPIGADWDDPIEYWEGEKCEITTPNALALKFLKEVLSDGHTLTGIPFENKRKVS